MKKWNHMIFSLLLLLFYNISLAQKGHSMGGGNIVRMHAQTNGMMHANANASANAKMHANSNSIFGTSNTHPIYERKKSEEIKNNDDNEETDKGSDDKDNKNKKDKKKK